MQVNSKLHAEYQAHMEDIQHSETIRYTEWLEQSLINLRRIFWFFWFGIVALSIFSMVF